MFDFPAGLLHWNQGPISGTFTNKGSLTISGAGLKQIGNKLINEGTMTFQASSNFNVGAQSIAMLDNRAGGLIEATESFQQIQDGSFGSGSTVLNAGTIRVDAGNDLGIRINLTNTGTVELGAGSQLTTYLTGASLASGSYHVGAGGSLQFQNLLTIGANGASLSLDGAGATVIGLSSLATNTGTLELGQGVTLGLTGALNNTGTLNLGAGSVLQVAGAFSQSDGGVLGSEVGLSSGTAKAGLIQATGAATLAGTLAITTADGFAPTLGQSAPVVTYASRTGDFATVTGLTVGVTTLFEKTTTDTAVTLASVASAANLAVTNVDAPSGALTVGSPITVTFTVVNRSGNPADGQWEDSVYLSRFAALAADAVLLGRVPRSGPVGAGVTYVGTLTTTIPLVANDSYRVIVIADSRGSGLDANHGDNLGVAPGTIQTFAAPLPLGSNASGRIADGGQTLYRVDVPSGQTLTLTLNGPVGAAEVAAQRGDAPNGSAADQVAYDPSTGQQTLTLTGNGAGPFYVSVRGRSPAGAGVGFTLAAASPSSFVVRSISPDQGQKNSTVTVRIDGHQFTPATKVRLLASSAVVEASRVIFVDSSTLYATFDFNLIVEDRFDVEVSDDGRTATLPGGFLATHAFPGNDGTASGSVIAPVDVQILGPEAVRVGTDQTLTIQYTNTANHPIAAPMLLLTSSNASFAVASSSAFSEGAIALLAINQDGPAGTLPAGYTGSIVVTARPDVAAAHVENDYAVAYVAEQDRVQDDRTIDFTPGLRFITAPIPIDWTSTDLNLRPPGLSDSAWAIILHNFETNVGVTMQDFVATLDRDATHFSTLGDQVFDVNNLIDFELDRAGRLRRDRGPRDAGFPGLWWVHDGRHLGLDQCGHRRRHGESGGQGDHLFRAARQLVREPAGSVHAALLLGGLADSCKRPMAGSSRSTRMARITRPRIWTGRARLRPTRAAASTLSRTSSVA